MGRIEFGESTFGSRTLEIITDGLYGDNINCLREYVQNSVDSKAKNVKIYFENGNQDLIIKDDGTGMEVQKLDKSLKIGISDKGGADVGWRGIGIWSGISAAEKLVIVTKARDHKPLRIEIDSNYIRNNSRSNRDAVEVLNEAVKEYEELPLGKGESLSNDHYTIIRLESILYPQRGSFTENKIEEFLAKTVPVPFNPKVFSYDKKIEKILDQYNVIFPSINVEFQGGKIYRPPNKSDIFDEEITIKPFSVDDKLVAIGWFLTSRTNDQREWPDAGILIKKKGFTIGNENLFRTYYTGSYSRWQYGEIHVISDEIYENAPRDGFEYNSGPVREFIDSIAIYFNDFQNLNRFKSAKLPMKKLQTAEKAIDKDKTQSAIKALADAKKSISDTRNPPPDPSFKGIIASIKNESEKIQSTAIGAIEAKIEKCLQDNRSEQLRLRRQHTDETIQRCKPAVRKQLQKLTKKPFGKLEINVMDSVKDLLKIKTQSKINGFKELTQESFGWGTVTTNAGGPKLTIDPSLNSNPDKSTKKIRLNRNLHFGVMLYALQELLVNIPKHEEGEESFEWWEKASEEEKYDIVDEIALTVNLAYRFVENAEKYNPLETPE